MSATAVSASRSQVDKENCHPDAAPLPLSSIAGKSAACVPNPVRICAPLPLPPPLTRRSSTSILRASIGHSNVRGGALSSAAAAAANATRLSLPARRKSVSFAAAMEEVRVFDSSDATQHNTNAAANAHTHAAAATNTTNGSNTANTAHTASDADDVIDDTRTDGAEAVATAKLTDASHTSTEATPTQPSSTHQLHDSPMAAAVAESEAEGANECDSMDFTQLLSSATLPSPPPASPADDRSDDMELTALLHSLPSLVSAAKRAARRTSTGNTNTSNATQQPTAQPTNEPRAVTHSPEESTLQPSDQVTDSLTAPLMPISLPVSVSPAAPAPPSYLTSDAAEASCDLTDWLVSLTPTVTEQSGAGFAEAAALEADAGEMYAYSGAPLTVASLDDADSSMEMTELIRPFHQPTQVAASECEDESADADMEMTAILSKWSERSHVAAVSPFNHRSTQYTLHVPAPAINSPSPFKAPASSAAASVRLSHRLLPLASPNSNRQQSHRQPSIAGKRVSGRQSGADVALRAGECEGDKSGGGGGDEEMPLYPSSSLLSRLSSCGVVPSSSRASVGVGALGDRTAVLSARWLQMLDDRPSQRSSQHRFSTASSAAIGDRTADIAAMLEAVLNDGQSTEEAMEAFYKQANDRLALAAQRHTDTHAQHRAEEEEEEEDANEQQAGDDDERADDDDNNYHDAVQLTDVHDARDHNAPLPLSNTCNPATSPLPSAEVAPAASDVSTNPIAHTQAAQSEEREKAPLDWSPLPARHRRADADTDDAEASPSPLRSSSTASPSPSVAPLPFSSLLDRAFHLLGVSSMDDSNLHAKLRKRDSSFQPINQHEHSEEAEEYSATAATEADGGGEAGASSGSASVSVSQDSLMSAIDRTLVRAEELDDLQAACLHLMDVNAQLREEAADAHRTLAQQHATAAAATESAGSGSSGHSLHQLLADIARSSTGNSSLPSPSSSLCRAASSHYEMCVHYARLSWLQWQTALNGASANKSDVGCRQIEADADMATEIAAMQAGLHQTKQAAINDTLIKQKRRDAVISHAQCVEAQQRLSALEEHTASQHRAERDMAVLLRDEALSLQQAAMDIEQQRADGQRRKQARSMLSAIATVSQCSLSSATPAYVDIALQPASHVVLRCARVKSASDAEPAANGVYHLTRLSTNELQQVSLPMNPVLLRVLQSVLDELLLTSGKQLLLSQVPALFRRCTGVAHRAVQWQQSIDTVCKQYGSRLIVSFTTRSVSTDVFSLSIRCQSPSRRHQLICNLSISLAVEPRRATSIVKHTVNAVSLDNCSNLNRAKQLMDSWLLHDRQDGYGQLQRVVGRLWDAVAAL